MSDRNAALDDELVLDVVANVLGKTGLIDDALVRATAVGNSTILRVTIPSEGVAVKRDDIIEYGLDIGNSDVGLRSVQVTPITYRLICTNGMRAWRSEAALRMRHIGDPKRLHDQLRDAVPVALAEARGDIDRWRRATEVLIDSALEEIEGLRTLGLSQGEVQSVPLCQRGVGDDGSDRYRIEAHGIEHRWYAVMLAPEEAPALEPLSGWRLADDAHVWVHDSGYVAEPERVDVPRPLPTRSSC